MEIPENIDLVDVYFKFDILAIFDYESILIWLANIIQIPIGKFFHSNESLNQYKKIRDNLNKVCEKYFKWDYTKFLDPIDQYLYIAQNYAKISEEIFKDVKPYSLDLVYGDITHFMAMVMTQFKNFSSLLVDKGLKHKFAASDVPNDHFLN